MDRYDLALGSLLGLFTGDAFGAQTEFETEEAVRTEHPDGILEMDSRTRAIGEAGFITDDSEMAIMLATSLIANNGFDARDVKQRYVNWLKTEPSDIGTTIFNALEHGVENPDSQANGALMRVAPIAIFGSNFDKQTVVEMSDGDCALTHIHTRCRDVNRLWALSIAKAIRDGGTKGEIYSYMCAIAPQYTDDTELLNTLDTARSSAPASCDERNQGWVLLAFHQALYTLLNCNTVEEGIKEITMRGGDADTNAAIYGMLAGAIEGPQALPETWVNALKPTRSLEQLFPDQKLVMKAFAAELATGLISKGTQS